MRVRNDNSALPAGAGAIPMRLKIISLATAVAVAVLLYALLVASGFSVYSEGVALTCHLDPDAATEEAGSHIMRVTDSDLAGLPKAKRMLDLALEHGPVMYGDGIIVLDAYLNSYRVSDHPIDGSIRVHTSMSRSEMNRYTEWIDAAGSSYFEYEGKIFSFGMWAS